MTTIVQLWDTAGATDAGSVSTDPSLLLATAQALPRSALIVLVFSPDHREAWDRYSAMSPYFEGEIGSSVRFLLVVNKCDLLPEATSNIEELKPLAATLHCEDRVFHISLKHGVIAERSGAEFLKLESICQRLIIAGYTNHESSA
jgi:hypothetical protein